MSKELSVFLVFFLQNLLSENYLSHYQGKGGLLGKLTTLKDISATFELRSRSEVRKDYHPNYMVSLHWKCKAPKRKTESFQRIEEIISEYPNLG